jgi:hypothetical protein
MPENLATRRALTRVTPAVDNIVVEEISSRWRAPRSRQQSIAVGI